MIIEIKKDLLTKKFLRIFEKKKNYTRKIGKGEMYYFNLEDFYIETKELFEKDINCWWK